MSDNDDDNFMDGDEDEYDLEYSETSNSEPDVDLENQVSSLDSLNRQHLLFHCMT